MNVKDFTEEEKNKLLSQYARLQYASLKRSVLQNMQNNSSESVLYRKYKKEEILKFLENPQKHEKEIRELSNYLYIVSSHYRRLIDYFPSILLYHYTVIPTEIPEKVNIKEYKRIYLSLIKECEKYNLKHEAMKAMKIAIRDGVFYGLCYESNDSFYIKPVQAKYANICGIEDGTYTFEFDLNYFNSNKNLLEMYGVEFVNAYDRYKGNKEKNIPADKSKRWYEPKNGICLKCDESDPYYSLPLFTGLLTSIFDIEDMKMLQKAKAENDNYKALGLHLETEEGIPTMDFELAQKYYNQIVDNIGNDGIGVFLSPFSVDDFSFASNSASDKNNVIEAEEEFYMSSGVNALLFGSTKANSSSSMLLSVKPDEQVAYSILLQFQRYFNKKIKKKNLEYGFKIEFIPQSIFNNTEYVDRYAKASQYGVCSKLSYAASLGYSPSDVEGLTFLEEDVLSLGKERWLSPLVSSNTQSSVGEGGRPTAEESGKQIGDAGEQTRNIDANDNR